MDFFKARLFLAMIFFRGLLVCEGKWTLEQAWNHFDKKGSLRLNPYFFTRVPVNVSVSIYVINLHALREDSMEFEFDCYFRMFWSDTRVMLPDEAGWTNEVDWVNLETYHLWNPDLFIANGRDSRRNSQVETFMRWHPDGSITSSFKVTQILSCDMNLRAFPFDQQECDVKIESYGNSAASMKLSWNKMGFNVNPDTYMRAFRYIDEKPKLSKDVAQTATADYELLKTTLKFKRMSSHYVVFVYLPSAMLVCLGALLFWLPTGALGERTTYSAFLFLAMVVLTAASQYAAPQVGYLKAMDIWCGACTFFLFAAITEVLILHLLRQRQEQRTVGTFHEMREEGNMETNVPPSTSSADTHALVDNLVIFRNPRVVHLIDLVLKVAYPATFVLFVIIYAAVFH